MLEGEVGTISVLRKQFALNHYATRVSLKGAIQ